MRLKNVIHASTYIRGYPMLTLYIADAERDAGMKNLSRKEALEILNGMKVKIKIPKAAVMQNKRNAALDMAIEALKYSEIPNSSTDCISRQAAVKALEETKQSEPFNRYEYQNIGIDWSIDAVKALPSAQTGWIPCSKKLPELNRSVLVQLSDDFVDPIQIMTLNISKCEGDFFYFWETQEMGINFEMGAVVAWMPLPKPWEGKEQ